MLDIRHLLLIHCADHPLQADGRSNVARQVAREQTLAGHRVSLTYLCPKCCAKRGELADFPIRVLPLSGIKLAGRVIRLNADLLKELTSDASPHTIFHIHHVRDPALLSIAHHLRNRGIPYAITTHGAYSHIVARHNRVRRLLVSFYLRSVESQILNGAMFVQAVTAAEREVVHCLAPHARCELIPNAAYSSRKDGVPTPPPNKLLSTCFPKFGYGGRYAGEHKGLDLLIEGFAEYRRGGGKGTLELFGSGPDGYPLAELAKDLGVSEFVEIGGPRFGDEKVRTLQSWDYFVMPSRYEGMPMAGLEAALHGLPLIVSDATGFREFVAHHRSGIRITNLTPSAIAQSFVCAEQVDGERWMEMSLASHRMALAIGDWTAIASQLVDLYRPSLRPITLTSQSRPTQR